MEEQPIRNVLTSLGISRRFCGYAIAIDAIRTVCQDESALLCCRARILLPLSEKYGRAPATIERNLRTIIRHAWLTNPRLLHDICGYPLASAPSVTEFIDIVSSYLSRKHPRRPLHP